MATVNLNNVHKVFDKIEVIRGIDADISDGKFIVIVGPSGCGKSTLLRMVAGLERITSGDILINGKQVNEVEPMDRNIAMVFQNYALYPHMTVAQNMGYGLKIAGLPKDEIQKKVAESAKLLQLESLLDRKPKQLSGGQRQRVAMGRAIVREPAVFLFDEPLSNLDAKLRVQMRLEIKELQTKLGVTTLYVTHDQVEAMTMADRMIVMNSGVAEQIGTSLDVYTRPQTQFVAQFIGSPAMNILNAEIIENKVHFAGVNICTAPTNFSKSKVKLGIRPEHIIVQNDEYVEFQTSIAEPLGANTIFHGTLNNGNFPFTASLPGVHRLGEESNILKLHFPPEHCHLFDPDTLKRVN